MARRIGPEPVQMSLPNDPDIQLADDLTQCAVDYLNEANHRPLGCPDWCDSIIAAGIIAGRIRELRT